MTQPARVRWRRFVKMPAGLLAGALSLLATARAVPCGAWQGPPPGQEAPAAQPGPPPAGQAIQAPLGQAEPPAAEPRVPAVPAPPVQPPDQPAPPGQQAPQPEVTPPAGQATTGQTETPGGSSGSPPTPGSGTSVPAEPGGEQSVIVERFLPRLEVFFPEGDLDLRVNRLINQVFFEGQVKYNFINGNITAFLRYRYYGLNHTTQLAVFDDISFAQVQKLSNEFDRTRGALAFFEWPHDFGRRTFALAELDHISTSRPEELITNNRTNTFVRVGYQLGSPGDGRSEAIVGETRARLQTLFTAVKEIGPNDFGFTGSLTYGFRLGLGNFDYLKFEGEALKRFDLTDRTFIVGRLHEGSFLHSEIISPEAAEPVNRYSIPLSEFFNLGGRDNLRGVSSDLVGTQEVHTTWELFFPWFLGENREVFHTEWENWYWVLYTGAGTIGFNTDAFGKFGAYAADLGFGFESSVGLGRYRFFLSGILARALKGEGKKLALSVLVRSFR